MLKHINMHTTCSTERTSISLTLADVNHVITGRCYFKGEVRLTLFLCRVAFYLVIVWRSTRRAGRVDARLAGEGR